MCSKRITTQAELEILQKYINRYRELSDASAERDALVNQIYEELSLTMPKEKIRRWFNNKINKSIRKESQRTIDSSNPINRAEYLPITLNASLSDKADAFPSVDTVLNYPLEAITQLYFNDCIYQKNKTLRNAKKTSRTFYFYCIKCQASIILKIQQNQELTIQYGRHSSHNDQCKVQPVLRTKLTMRLNELRDKVIRKYHDSGNPRNINKISAEFAKDCIEYMAQNPEELMPVITEELVRKWINESRPITHTPRNCLQNPIPNELMKYNGHDWVRIIEINADNSIMIFFFRDEALKLAAFTPRLLLDGTFKTCPRGFSQVFNGCGFNSHTSRYYPLFHVLLQRADKTTYVKCLYQILQALKFRQLNKILFDFEKALIGAVEEVFKVNYKDAMLQGCFFHYMKAIRERLELLYGKPLSEECNRHILIFDQSPFLSDQNLRILIEYMKNTSKLKEFMIYYDSTWGYGGMFPPHLWNASAKPDPNFVTNDGIERMHSSMFDELGIHPALSKFITTLYEIDSTCQATAEHNREGDIIDNQHTEKEAISQIKKIIGDISFISEKIEEEPSTPVINTMTGKKRLKQKKKLQRKSKDISKKRKNHKSTDNTLEISHDEDPATTPNFPLCNPPYFTPAYFPPAYYPPPYCASPYNTLMDSQNTSMLNFPNIIMGNPFNQQNYYPVAPPNE